MTTALAILQAAGLHDTYWGRRIIAAEVRCRFTSGDRVKASSWTTCACGKIDIARDHENDEPKNFKLQQLGICFMFAVKQNKFVLSASHLIGIERHVAELAGTGTKTVTKKRKAVTT